MVTTLSHHIAQNVFRRKRRRKQQRRLRQLPTPHHTRTENCRESKVVTTAEPVHINLRQLLLLSCCQTAEIHRRWWFNMGKMIDHECPVLNLLPISRAIRSDYCFPPSVKARTFFSSVSLPPTVNVSCSNTADTVVIDNNVMLYSCAVFIFIFVPAIVLVLVQCYDLRSFGPSTSNATRHMTFTHR